jgi:hypothetical protein
MKALKNDPVPVPDDMFKSRYPPITGSLWPALQMGNSHKLEVVSSSSSCCSSVDQNFAGKVC